MHCQHLWISTHATHAEDKMAKILFAVASLLAVYSSMAAAQLKLCDQSSAPPPPVNALVTSNTAKSGKAGECGVLPAVSPHKAPAQAGLPEVPPLLTCHAVVVFCRNHCHLAWCRQRQLQGLPGLLHVRSQRPPPRLTSHSTVPHSTETVHPHLSTVL